MLPKAEFLNPKPKPKGFRVWGLGFSPKPHLKPEPYNYIRPKFQGLNPRAGAFAAALGCGASGCLLHFRVYVRVI